MPEPFLQLDDLRIVAGTRTLVDGASLRLVPGQILALVGASGSGKTLTARACLGLVDPRPGIVGGELTVCDGDKTWRPFGLARRQRSQALRAIRGTIVGWLPQDARASLDPLRPIGAQLRRVLALRAADGIEIPQDRPDVRSWLSFVDFPDPDRVARLYPHELSGGMAQRACIALALARGSRFLLADEPTTGLDPTVQAGILDQLGQLATQGCGVLLITHDLRIVPRLADQVYVMDSGRFVDLLPATDLAQATSPAAQALVAATRRIAGGAL